MSRVYIRKEKIVNNKNSGYMYLPSLEFSAF